MVSRLRNIVRWFVKSLVHPVFHLLDRPDYVCYYPIFQHREDLINHYFRARWYLPAYRQVCTKVTFARAYEGGLPEPGDRPLYMCDVPGSASHIRIVSGSIRLWVALLRSQVVLFWMKPYPFLALLFRLLGKKVNNVTTGDPASYEYSTYANLMWVMLPEQRRQEIVEENKARFAHYMGELRGKGYRTACVFGNGPTLEDAFSFDFSDGVRIMCNTVASNTRLLSHVQPHFIAAADEVSHYGVSIYADRFRSDLIKALNEYNFYFVALAQPGFLLTVHFPELCNRAILIPYQAAVPNYDLLHDFWLPGLESVLNCIMLPIAATLVDEIRLLGCDGKSPKQHNEDFWAHGKGSQYEVTLVNSGHFCHPTFDIHRQSGGYERYNDHVALTVITGEREYNKKYRCLRPSHTPVLSTRLIQ